MRDTAAVTTDSERGTDFHHREPSFLGEGEGFVGTGELKAGDELVKAVSVNGGLADGVTVTEVPKNVAGEAVGYWCIMRSVVIRAVLYLRVVQYLKEF